MLIGGKEIEGDADVGEGKTFSNEEGVGNQVLVENGQLGEKLVLVAVKDLKNLTVREQLYYFTALSS